MRLEYLAMKLLTTLTDEASSRISPMDFTALLYLRDKGYAEVSVVQGCVVAERTPAGKKFASGGTGTR